MMTRRLQVTLSPALVADRAFKLARKIDEIKEVQREKSVANSEWSSRIKRLEDDVAVLSETVLNGFEEQDVEVQEERDYSNRVMRIIRTDTATQVDVRPLTESEMGQLQVDAFSDAGGSVAAADGSVTATQSQGEGERVRKDIE